MANERQAIILPSREAKPHSDCGGKNSNEADGIKLDDETDIKRKKIKIIKLLDILKGPRMNRGS